MKSNNSFMLVLFLGLSLMATEACARLSVNDESLMIDLQRNPRLVEDIKNPAFSWRLLSNQRGEKQSAYRIIVKEELEKIPGRAGKLIWDSGKIASDSSSGVRYAGPELKKSVRYFWSVQVWDRNDQASAFSSPGYFDTALGNTWQARPIWFRSPEWKNFTVEFDLKIVRNAAGFILDSGDNGSYHYQFSLPQNEKSAAILKKSLTTPESDLRESNSVKLKLDSNNIKLDEFNRIKFEISDNHITTFINDVVIDKAQNRLHAEGAFGLWTENRDDQFIIRHLTVRKGETQLYRNDFDGTTGSPFPVPAITIRNGELTAGLDKTSPLYNEVGPVNTVMETIPDWVFIRKAFRLRDKPISRAVLYATGQSPEETRQYVYKAYINGHFAGLGPARGYDGKHFYNAFDITPYLDKGAENVIGAIALSYGQKKSFMAEIRIVYQDGDTQIIGSDASWKSKDGSMTFPYTGDVHAQDAVAWVGFRYPHENINAEKYPEGFDRSGYDDSGWTVSREQAGIPGLTGYPAENLTEMQVKPVKVTQIAAGHFLLDYGVTVVGGMQYKPQLPLLHPARITLKTGEVLDSAGNVKWQTAALVNNLDEWMVPPGQAAISQFGYRVFRYAEISGLPPAITAENLSGQIRAVALRYPFDEKASAFSSSDAMLNKIWNFSKTSIKVLNHDLYVDSPNRERAPYEADTYIQQLSNYQLDRDYSLARLSVAWLIDHSTWPMEWKVYNILNAWNDYFYTGDDGLIRKNYERLKLKLPAKLIKGFDQNTGLVTADYGDGKPGPDHDIVDWPASLRAGYQFSDTHNVANVFFFKGTQRLSEIAGVVGNTKDSEKYRQLSVRSAEGFRTSFYDRDRHAFRDNIGGKPHISSQSNAFAVNFGIADMKQSDSAALFLAEKKMLEGSVYSALFALNAMAENGQGSEAVHQITGLNQDGSRRPGTHNWRHMIENGSGSTMEAWNESDDLTVSHSHAWGTAPVIVAVQGLFGIRPLRPAYALFQVKPILDGLSHASIQVPTIRGDIAASFTRTEGKWALAVDVPANTEADIYVPGAISSNVRESGESLSKVEGVVSVSETGKYVKVRVGSGHYRFISYDK
ncbi:family 78 glycoside hydrolase catalytic domain [Pantoea dispersa]